MVTTKNGTNGQAIFDQSEPTSYLTDQANLNICKIDKTEPNIKYTCFLGEFETRVYWGNVFYAFLIHVVFIYGLFKYPVWTYTWEYVYGIFLTGLATFGVTAGVHRLWTHRTYKAKLPLKLILLLCYTLSRQLTVLKWVMDHRVHHKYSDTDADPHNANRGFWFSHVGWLCRKKHPEVLRKGKTIDVSDITSDPLVAFHVRHWTLIKILIGFVIPSIIPPLVFGRDWGAAIWTNCFFVLGLNFNISASVNSFAHTWGNKPFNKNIRPAENKLVTFFALGEGWHNYHHTFPWDYRTAELGSPFNVTTILLNIFAKIGWAYDLKTTSPELVESFVNSKGDGSYTSIKKH